MKLVLVLAKTDIPGIPIRESGIPVSTKGSFQEFQEREFRGIPGNRIPASNPSCVGDT